ncbi:MAG: hypothetical protein D6692_09755 [Planctomycetota bacterium]|nr:MAG: hypothetical protein D6692_09755 [Planctomycetota bacterium]
MPGNTVSDQPGQPRPMLLADDATIPTVQVTWRSVGRDVTREGARPFAAPDDAEPFEGCNLSASVSLGGTRLEVGAGHPRGAVLRVEIRKTETHRAFFPGIDPGSSFRVEVRGVRFNQPVRVDPDTALVHLKYSLKDVEACSLPPSAANQFLLANQQDTLGGMVAAGVNATPGGLSGEPGRGSVEARVEADGSVTFAVVMPYALLRHLQDPWASDLPGTFFEPIRLHAEIEVLPVWAEPIVREHPPLDQPYERPTLED